MIQRILNTTLKGEHSFILKAPIFIVMKRMSSGIIVKSTYGREIASNDDDYVKLAAATMVAMASLGVPGLNAVDLFPFCESETLDIYFLFIFSVRHVPSWLPGAQLLRKAREVKKLVQRMVDEPYEQVKTQMVSAGFACKVMRNN